MTPWRDAADRRVGRSRWVWLAMVVPAIALAAPASSQTDPQFHVLRLQATPIGALPQMALPMPASRNHNYWGGRLQAGRRIGRGGSDLLAVAGGVDLQWRGGSIYGLTAGYQERDCSFAAEPGCGGHALFGARGRFNVVTGGPTLASMVGDYSATTTVGAELGLGFAPNVLPSLNACTVDLGMPVSIAMLQTVRLVTWVTPSIAWDLSCSREPSPNRASYLASFGVGVQQLGSRGLDVYVGLQRIFRSAAGYQFGVSVTYVRLP
jgi:hypothetical protein